MLGHRLRNLSAGHGIVMADVEEDMHTIIPEDGPGWIDVWGKPTLRRIPWLAELKNMNLEPWRELTDENALEKAVALLKIIFLRIKGWTYGS